MTSFSDLGLSENALAAVRALGYDSPTPVQEKAIPAVLEGRDVIAAAKTGTGKTAAFSLPSLDRLDHARHGQGPLMLVVTPTRELAMQIEKVCRTVSKSTHHQVTCVVGGVPYPPQEKALRKGCDVLIATPGRLIDLMERNVAHLGQVETLVLDEADRMLDMGFLPAMKKIVAATPKQRQTLLFSATIDAGIKNNMGHLLSNPVFVEIAHKGETADTVEQYVIPVDQRMKGALLEELLKEKGSERVIVFSRTKHRADNCCRKLRRAGIKTDVIHSDRNQNQRKRALDAFASGKTDVLVATDVLARGIDVSEVEYVVNFDLPDQAEDYVHRIGRTGRAGQQGFAVSFVTPEGKPALREIEKLIGRKIPTMALKNFDAAANEELLAARATRKTARKDPELAAAAKEHAKKQQRSQQKHSENGKGNQPHKTRGTAKKQDKKNQKAGNRPKQSQQNSNKPAKKGGPDMRPGRANRARNTAKHNRQSR